MTRSAIKTLLTEILYGTPPEAEGTWFVQGKEALLTTFKQLTAEEASTSPAKGISTVAAHTIHTAYYIDLAIQHLQGGHPEGDWPGSWAKQTVTPDEWRSAQIDLAQKIDDFNRQLLLADFSNPDTVTYCIANVGHAAYHLGAIRQIFLMVKSQTALPQN